MWRGKWFVEDDRFNMGAYTFHWKMRLCSSDRRLSEL
jgi:hypothetical protein